MTLYLRASKDIRGCVPGRENDSAITGNLQMGRMGLADTSPVIHNDAGDLTFTDKAIKARILSLDYTRRAIDVTQPRIHQARN